MRYLAATMVLLVGAAAARAESPEVDYLLQCRGCHLPDGAGTPGSVPPLAGRVARFLSVPGGRAYLVQVPGSAQSALDDAELAALLNWMVRHFGPEEDARRAAPYSAEEVGSLRERPLTDVAATRQRLLDRMQPVGGDDR